MLCKHNKKDDERCSCPRHHDKQVCRRCHGVAWMYVGINSKHFQPVASNRKNGKKPTKPNNNLRPLPDGVKRGKGRPTKDQYEEDIDSSHIADMVKASPAILDITSPNFYIDRCAGHSYFIVYQGRFPFKVCRKCYLKVEIK